MAITINGTGTITGISAGGLPDGSVVAADLASSLDLTGKTVTLPSGTGGKILQVVQGTPKTDTFSTTSSTPVDITGLNVTITPSSTNSKILVYAGVNCGSASSFVGLYLLRGSTQIFLGDASGSKDRVSINFMTDNNRPSAQTLMFLDEPATTSATTYKMQITTNSTTSYVNRASNEADSSAYMRGASNMIAIEVAA